MAAYSGIVYGAPVPWSAGAAWSAGYPAAAYYPYGVYGATRYRLSGRLQRTDTSMVTVLQEFTQYIDCTQSGELDLQVPGASSSVPPVNGTVDLEPARWGMTTITSVQLWTSQPVLLVGSGIADLAVDGTFILMGTNLTALQIQNPLATPALVKVVLGGEP